MQSDLTKLQPAQQAPLTASEFLGSLPSGYQFQTLMSVPLDALQQTQADSSMWEQAPSSMPQQETTARTPSVSTHGTTTCTRSVGKGKGKSKLGKEPKRMKWSNDMIAELLRLRFTDGDVKRRIDSADTKTNKALAWQFFASVLSQSLGLVITQEQVYQKYRKLKSLYQKEKREMRRTGNDTSPRRDFDEALWEILNDAFASKEGISGDVLADTNDDDGTGSPDSEEADDSTSKGKLPPVTQLANAMESGMTAIATAMSTQPSTDEQLRSLASALEQQTRAIEVQQ